jgi:hypothetical protein
VAQTSSHLPTVSWVHYYLGLREDTGPSFCPYTTRTRVPQRSKLLHQDLTSTGYTEEIPPTNPPIRAPLFEFGIGEPVGSDVGVTVTSAVVVNCITLLDVDTDEGCKRVAVVDGSPTVVAMVGPTGKQLNVAPTGTHWRPVGQQVSPTGPHEIVPSVQQPGFVESVSTQ